MNLGVLDWSIIGGFLLLLFGIAAVANRQTRSVSDFLAANRCAGRYLLTLADGMAALGAIAVVAGFEKFYQSGFGGAWWGMMLAPVAMLVAMSGWVVYRYRRTRAMTMAQFFEMRYSRRFRIYAGSLGWISGVLNYGVFPGVTALFLMHFCGLPESFSFLGFIWPTQPVLMGTMLGVAVFFTLAGGLIAVMLTDFLQAMLLNVTFIAIFFVLFFQYSWGDISTTLNAAPSGKSMFDPFGQGAVEDFNVWFFLILAFKLFYNCLGWQGNQGYNAAAKSPHEAKMARVLAEWRGGITYMLLLFAPIAAYVALHNGSDLGAAVIAQIAEIADPQTQEQMRVPIFLSAVLPAGLLGLFAASILAAAISTDDTQLHSWGSIFVQDIIVPLRGRPLEPHTHMRLLRLSVLGVAIFAFFWSLYFPIRDYIFMYFLLTGTIYLGGSGCAIIGGLYWRRATPEAAWSAMTVGWVSAGTGLLLQTIWPSVPALVRLAPAFPLNGAWLAMVAYGLSITAFVAVALVTSRNRELFDLRSIFPENSVPERMKAEPEGHGDPPRRSRLHRLLGINEEFTLGDRLIYYLKFFWTMGWFVVFLVGCSIGLTIGFGDGFWENFWLVNICIYAFVGTLTVVWFTIGGFHDFFALIRQLQQMRRDAGDDGFVSGHSTPHKSEEEKK